MLLNAVLLLPYLLSLVDGQSAQCGRRPTQLMDIESQCESVPEVKDSLLERIEHRAKSFFDKAKQELGIKSNATVEPRKCEYYKCIFERLGMLNQLNLPDLSLMQTWINNLDDANKEELNAAVATCFRLLATSALNIQNNCEIATHLMMCLHSGDKCKVFKFP